MIASKKLQPSLEARYHHPKMRMYIDNYACSVCQKHKLDGKGYGLLPMWDSKEQPFEEVAVDLIGQRICNKPLRGKRN